LLNALAFASWFDPGEEITLEKGFTNFLSRQMAAKIVEMGKEGGFFSLKAYFARRYNF